MVWYDSNQKMAVREYRSQSEFEKDAAAAAEKGWSVVSVTDRSQRSGCLRMLTLGLFALVWKPKPRIMVTYSH